jgi:L-xylulokinase
MPKYLLGTDNGGTIAKAALFTLDGREVAVASRKTEMLSPCPGQTERDMEALWRATAESIAEVLAEAQASPADVACVACTGHGNGLYLVDAEGRPVRSGIISPDTRAKDYVARWYAEGVAERVRPHTMQSLWPGQPNALLAWLRDHEPETLRRAAWALMCKDFIRLRLTGEVYGELTDMSGTSLMSVRDAVYRDDVLAAFGLEDFARLLPPLCNSEAICGKVTAEAARQTGLAEGTPVAGGLFDIDACALSSGLLDETQLSMVAGTWSINQYVSRTPVVDPDIFMNARYCLPDYFLIPEASATSASNLEWFVSQFFQAESQAAQAEGRSVYPLVNDLVARAKPEETNLYFLPFLFGSNAQPDARACLIGLGAWHDRGHAMRAIYEGVVFGHKWHVDRLMRFRSPAAVIRLAGGAARSPVWSQIFADVMQTPVEIPCGSELGALGAAIAAAVAIGCYSSYEEAVAAMVKIGQTFVPDPQLGPLYAEKYGRYRRLIEALGPVWPGLG